MIGAFENPAHDEGVIKFRVEHEQRALSPREHGELANKLIAWREILARTGLVGQDPALYGGAGYGNVSARVGAPASPRGARPFLISGTQTSGLARIDLPQLCLVRRYVLHAHTPAIWRQARRLRLPTTNAVVAYGTVEMAQEVRRLYRDTALGEQQIFSMGGHEDGVVVFGRSVEEAGGVLVRALARALALANDAIRTR